MSFLSSLLNPEIVMGITDVVYNKSVSIHQDVAYLNVHNTAFKWVRMFNGSFRFIGKWNEPIRFRMSNCSNRYCRCSFGYNASLSSVAGLNFKLKIDTKWTSTYRYTISSSSTCIKQKREPLAPVWIYSLVILISALLFFFLPLGLSFPLTFSSSTGQHSPNDRKVMRLASTPFWIRYSAQAFARRLPSWML